MAQNSSVIQQIVNDHMTRERDANTMAISVHDFSTWFEALSKAVRGQTTRNN